MRTSSTVALAAALVAATNAPPAADRAAMAGADHVSVEGDGIRIEFDHRLHSRVVATLDGAETALGDFRPSESVSLASADALDFTLIGREDDIAQDALGAGRRVTLTGRAGSLRKTVAVTTYANTPGLAVLQVRYTNEGESEQVVRGWTNNGYALSAGAAGKEPAFWSYQAGSYESRPDWVRPLEVGFRQENFQGMNATDYGGGVPVVDAWRRDVGLAVGHLELAPKQVSLPVARPSVSLATVAVIGRDEVRLAPRQSFDTPRTFVAVHRGDHFRTLSLYRELMARQGVVMRPAPAAAFEPIWCAWGYGRDFTPDQVIATLPVAKRLGLRWATLDDGWQVAEGDWTPRPEKFPRGDADMKALVDRIHAEGLRAQLWWAPLAADPGTALLREHPEQLLLEPGDKTRKITWWDSLYLCPAYAPVRQDAQAFVRKALGEWGFDGLKIDGQHVNGVPPCHNAAHGHARPLDAVEGLPGFFQTIDRAAHETKADALVEICPCGTAYSSFTLPFLNMVVASDPTSSWQVRLKGKTLKALVGDRIAYFGDHVELSDRGSDFASTVGVGGVVGTNFAWPGAPGKKDPKLLLTPEREKAWAFWVDLYRRMRLPEGSYLGTLYDIGFDRPEAHVIRKDDRLYYAFYAPEFAGSVELRGLDAAEYRVRDYVADRDLGLVRGPVGRLNVTFRDYLLIAAIPNPTRSTPSAVSFRAPARSGSARVQ